MTDNPLASLANGDTTPGAGAKKPAAKKAATKGKRGPGRPPKAKPVDIATKVEESFTALSVALLGIGMAKDDSKLLYDSQVILANGPKTGEALAELADQDPKIRAALEKMFTASSWSKIVMVMLSTVGPIAACHGLAPIQIAEALAPDIPLPSKETGEAA